MSGLGGRAEAHPVIRSSPCDPGLSIVRPPPRDPAPHPDWPAGPRLQSHAPGPRRAARRKDVVVHGLTHRGDTCSALPSSA